MKSFEYLCVSFGLWIHLDLTFSLNPSKMHGFEKNYKNKSTPSIIILSVPPILKGFGGMTPQNLENLLIGMKKPLAKHEMFRHSI